MASLFAKNARVVRVPGSFREKSEGDTVNLWQHLRGVIQDVLEKGDSGQRFDDVYLRAYAMVVQGQGALLHGGLREAVTGHLVNKVRPAVLASAPDAFLRTLNQAWDDHQARMRQIRNIVLYLERQYVPQNNVCSVHNLGVLLFRDEVARHADIRGTLQKTLLQMVSLDRKGKTVDRLSIKSACEMLGKLGVNSRSVYEEDFERPFLAESAKFYALERQKHLAEKSAIEYIDMAEQRINEESERAKVCLYPGTEHLIKQVVYQELVTSHVKAIVEKEDSGVAAMLKNQRVKELTRMFRLLSHAENNLKVVAECVSKYLRELGRSLMAEDGDGADSLCLVKQLMDLKDHYEHLLNSCFNDERLVKQMINADFEYILSLTRKTPEHVALFADDILKNGIKGMTEQEIKQLLDKIVMFVRLLHEKDLFERFYKQYLCERLLLNNSASQDVEKAIISKLKVEWGPMFTPKFEVMLKDIATSATITEEFKATMASCKLGHELDFNVRVLTTGFWPFPAATQQCNIPAAPLGVFQTFRRLYLAKHDGRRLDLQPQLGWADMKAVFYPPDEPSTSLALPVQLNEPRTHVIVVSTHQMCVLMLFNDRDHITYEDIASETGIPETDLVRALELLTVGKTAQRVLVKDPPTNNFEPSHVFAVNESFTLDMKDVNVYRDGVKKEGFSKGSETAVRNIEEDRRGVIEAAIVRIMKSERKLSHSELVIKLTGLLSARFTPSPEAIKKRIEALIDRDYLERAPENAEVYIYVP